MSFVGIFKDHKKVSIQVALKRTLLETFSRRKR